MTNENAGVHVLDEIQVGLREHIWEVKYQLSLGFCDRNRGRGSAQELKGSGLLDQSGISEFFQLANLESKTATPAHQIPKILAIGEQATV